MYDHIEQQRARSEQLARHFSDEATHQWRKALTGFIALKPTLTMEARELVQTGDLALYLSRWNLRGTGPDGKEVRMNGSSTDVLRRQSDGRWLIVIDNPWGIALLAK